MFKLYVHCGNDRDIPLQYQRINSFSLVTINRFTWVVLFSTNTTNIIPYRLARAANAFGVRPHCFWCNNGEFVKFDINQLWFDQLMLMCRTLPVLTSSINRQQIVIPCSLNTSKTTKTNTSKMSQVHTKTLTQKMKQANFPLNTSFITLAIHLNLFYKCSFYFQLIQLQIHSLCFILQSFQKSSVWSLILIERQLLAIVEQTHDVFDTRACVTMQQW